MPSKKIEPSKPILTVPPWHVGVKGPDRDGGHFADAVIELHGSPNLNQITLPNQLRLLADVIAGMSDQFDQHFIIVGLRGRR